MALIRSKGRKERKERKNFNFSMEQDTGLEPAPSAWKADMLATNTIPAWTGFHDL